MKKGKYYEDKTAKIIKTLNPESRVFQGVEIMGELSKTSREVDVQQYVSPNTYDYIVFECKDHKAKIDVKHVESFVTKLQGFSKAKKGAMVSNSGYTLGARNVAKAFGIDLLSLVDTGDEKIKTKVSIPVIVEETFVSESWAQATDNIGAIIVNPEGFHFAVETPLGFKYWYEIFESQWNDYDVQQSPDVGWKKLTLKSINITNPEGEITKVKSVDILYKIDRRHFTRKLDLEDTQGILDVATGAYQTQSMVTEAIDTQSFQDPKIWVPISKEESDSMIVNMRMHAYARVAVPDENRYKN